MVNIPRNHWKTRAYRRSVLAVATSLAVLGGGGMNVASAQETDAEGVEERVRSEERLESPVDSPEEKETDRFIVRYKDNAHKKKQRQRTANKSCCEGRP